MAALIAGTSGILVCGLVLTALPLAKKKNLRGSRGKMWTSANLNPHVGQEPIYCRLCDGEGTIPCTLCNKTGILARGGFAKRNTIRVPSLVGSKWTSVSAIDGKWRHFLCTAKKGKNTKDGIAILSSTCGPVENRIRIEVPLKELKTREMWEGGWTTLNDIRGAAGVAGTTCSACRGLKAVMCPRCDGLGQVGL
ncbi:unnamed protein product [Chondrus crispus]|uniref:Uncharacterized protein n=1 Tax=Chondrus crispus TaxID=2769 RepID=R7QDR9_CHOCR|nr:unnamed protein product [Chondrus crispus]CDF35586.1 unnamed protein product [Chondrus crispus]|eukprot:XP_005715405.1 unnamed protein product [Chondrus crispus]